MPSVSRALPLPEKREAREEADGRKNARSTVARLWDLLGRTRAFGLAAEMAFWLFLSLLPLAAVAAFVAARLALHDWTLLAPLMASIPEDAGRVIQRELSRVAAWNGGAVTPVAGVFFVWLASTGIHAIFDAFEAQTGATRSWVKKRLLAMASCVALSCAFAAVALLGKVFAWGEGHLSTSASRLGQLLAIAGSLGGGVAVLYLVVAGLYRIGIPREARERMPLAPGTALVVVLHLTLGAGYRLYLSTLGNGSAYLAGLAVIGVTQTALYLSSSAILVGLGLNQVLGLRRNAACDKSAPAGEGERVHADAPRKSL